MEVINYKVPSLKDQKITEDLGCQIEFHDSYIVYILKFFAEEPINAEDKTLGVDMIERNYSCLFWKKDIGSLEMEWRQEIKLWLLVVQLKGLVDTRFYFKKESDCKAMLDKFISYVEPV